MAALLEAGIVSDCCTAIVDPGLPGLVSMPVKIWMVLVPSGDARGAKHILRRVEDDLGGASRSSHAAARPEVLNEAALAWLPSTVRRFATPGHLALSAAIREGD